MQRDTVVDTSVRKEMLEFNRNRDLIDTQERRIFFWKYVYSRHSNLETRLYSVKQLARRNFIFQKKYILEEYIEK